MKFSKLTLRNFAMYVTIVSCALFLWGCPKDSSDKLSVYLSSLTFEANETGEKTVLISTDAPSVESIPSVDWIMPTVQGTTLLTVKVKKTSSRTGTIMLS